MIRNQHRLGDWLVVDDITGFTIYASESVKLWDGRITHVSNFETRHPQEFIKARRDPKPVPFVRTEPLAVLASSYSSFIGQTDIPTPIGPATHIFVSAADPPAPLGIGDATIGSTFIVR